MKIKTIYLFTFLLITILFISGCGKKETEEKEVDIKSVITQNSIKFKCDAISNNYILYFDNNYLILSNNKIYKVLLDDKLFSNKQQCLEIPLENKIKIKKVKGLSLKYNKYQPFIIDENNITYFINEDTIETVEDDNNYTKDFINSFLLDDDIEKVISLNKTSNNKNNSIYFLILKSDGYLYKAEYSVERKYNNKNTNNSTTTIYTLLNEKILSVSDEIGKIYNFENCSSNNCHTSKSSNNMSEEDNIATKGEYIITSKGLYNYEEIKTKYCTKYEDVTCQSDFVRKELYDVIKYDIKYFDNNIILLKDGRLLSPYNVLNETEQK